MSQVSRDWWKTQLSLSLIIQLVVMGGGWLLFVGTVKATLSDHDRRINTLEAEIVPRREHEAAAKIEEQKEKLIDERMTNIERMLVQILERGTR